MAIAEQASEAAKATEAMQKSTVASVEGQRPIITATVIGSPVVDLMPNNPVKRVRVSLSNCGNTTAYDCLYESWIELLPDPFIDFTASAEHYKSSNGFTLYPGKGEMIVKLPFTKGVPEAQIRDVKAARLYICLRIYLTFRDAFTPKRYTNFGLRIMYEGWETLPKYNDSN
jgi:hypothetical protein